MIAALVRVLLRAVMRESRFTGERGFEIFIPLSTPPPPRYERRRTAEQVAEALGLEIREFGPLYYFAQPEARAAADISMPPVWARDP